jgi:hypothetical protein
MSAFSNRKWPTWIKQMTLLCKVRYLADRGSGNVSRTLGNTQNDQHKHWSNRLKGRRFSMELS